MRKRINWLALLVCIAIPLIAGWISNILTGGKMHLYDALNLPALAPPRITFPIVWIILYILMGIASYLIYMSEDSKLRKRALVFYGIQLVVNMLWPFMFFGMQNYLLAFIWLIILIILVIYTMYLFHRINKTAAYLLIPYIIWLLFAGYINLMVYLLN